MWYFYVLESLKGQSLYKGCTNDLKRRINDEHNKKRGGKHTSKHAPYKLIYYEAYIEKADAVKAEIFFKTGYGRDILKGKIENYLKRKSSRLSSPFRRTGASLPMRQVRLNGM